VGIEKANNESEIRNLNRILHNSEGSVAWVLSQGIEKNEFKTEDMKKLVCTLI
jgi:hypothetical protein